MTYRGTVSRASLLAATLAAAAAAPAYAVDPAAFSALHWRLIGPFRAGRAITATGVPGQPDAFYFGAVGGGVWKTVNAGRTWTPIFDSQPVASIGAIAVAPSDPNVIYVGSGEADMRSQISYGNGMYRSRDAGATWERIGLEDTRQIGRILVDPRNPDLVFVAALGHAYGPNEQRGVFRSRDGGASWEKVLYKDADTGAIDLAFDPRDPRAVWAAMWQTRRPPWNVYPPSNGRGSGLYRSTDGGDTWQHVAGHGLPAEGLGRIGIAIARSLPSRMVLVVDATEGGIYRSDDTGASWRRVDAEARVWKRGWYFGGIEVDPKDPDTVYVMNTAMYRSRDGGSTFTSIKGAPGGDDYHSLWIDPDRPERLITATDQGVIVSVDGGETWSSWYNQPTAQLYHVAADNHVPYWVFGAQQDSGAMGTPVRSRHRAITFRDWAPSPAGDENGYVAPDPLDPDIVYGGTVARWDRRTGEVRNVSPTLAYPGEYRRTWTLPLVFSERDPHELYFSHQILFRTKDGGGTWQVLSPDLTREDPGVPPNLDEATAADGPSGKRRGVIYTIAPSPLRAGEIWVGTDDGLIQVTRDDGASWHDVTPPPLTAWSKVAMLLASHYDADTAYAAVDRHRLEDYRPYLYRTRDGGATWTNAVAGIPDGQYLNCVREDPVRPGLLFAGTEMGVWVSFDDGDHWQPLQLDLPNASVRDLAIHADDLVAATHGRSIWVLDDIAPLREASDAVLQADAYLFAPRAAWRMREGDDDGTPVPKDEAAGENPPDGASLNYFLRTGPKDPVVLEIIDAGGFHVRRYASDDVVQPVKPAELEYPESWATSPPVLSAEPGMHRFMWDLHWEARAGLGRGRGRRASSGGPWALPGRYTVRLAAGGVTIEKPLTVAMDPRVTSEPEDLEMQLEISTKIADAQVEAAASIRAADRLLEQVQAAHTGPKKLSRRLAAALDSLEKELCEVAGPSPAPYSASPRAAPPPADPSSLRHAAGMLATVYGVVQGADAAPSPDALTAFRKAQDALHDAESRLATLRTRDIPRVNTLLRRAKLPPLAANEEPPPPR